MDETGRSAPATPPGHDPSPDDLESLDNVALTRIAYRRADSVTERMRAERAARILASRADRAREAATARVPAARPDVIDNAGVTDRADVTDNAEDDEHSRPWVTRARVIGAGVLIASLAVGGALGLGIDRAIGQLAPDSLAIFDRAQTDGEATVAAELSELEFLFAGEEPDLRQLATIDEVAVFAQLLPVDFGTPRSDVGERVCVYAVDAAEGDAGSSFFAPHCVPRGVFERDGLASVLYEVPTNGFATPADEARAVSVAWGPRGDASADLLSLTGEQQ